MTPLRVYEAEVEAIEARIEKVTNPLHRWRYRRQARKLKHEISTLRDEQIAALLKHKGHHPGEKG